MRDLQMNRRICGFNVGKCFVLAISVLALAAGPNHAGWLGFRNDLTIPVIVRTNIVVNNKVGLGKTFLMYPGDVSWDAIIQGGNRQIVIVDAKKPARVLFQDVVPVNNDTFYSVQVDTPTRAKIVPTKMPPPPKRGR
jgi:hypothetical protein